MNTIPGLQRTNDYWLLVELPRESGFGILYSLAAELGTWDHPLMEGVAPRSPYPMPFVTAAKWRCIGKDRIRLFPAWPTRGLWRTGRESITDQQNKTLVPGWSALCTQLTRESKSSPISCIYNQGSLQQNNGSLLTPSFQRAGRRFTSCPDHPYATGRVRHFRASGQMSGICQP